MKINRLGAFTLVLTIMTCTVTLCARYIHDQKYDIYYNGAIDSIWFNDNGVYMQRDGDWQRVGGWNYVSSDACNTVAVYFTIGEKRFSGSVDAMDKMKGLAIISSDGKWEVVNFMGVVNLNL